MHIGKKWFPGLLAMAIIGSVVAACAPPAAPTPTPTKAPTAAPTQVQPSKAPASTPTAPPAALTPTPKPVTVKFGSTASVSDIGVWMAMEKGYFAEQGIITEIADFRVMTDIIAPLGTGQLDAAAMSLGVPVLQAADRGVEFKIVANRAQSRPNWEHAWVLLRKDLAGTVKVPSDLKGMKIGITSTGSTADQGVQILMEQAKLTPADLEVVVIPLAEVAVALSNKAVAAAYSLEPQLAVAVQQGFAVKWIPVSQLFGGAAQTSTIVFGPNLLKNPDLARRWMTAYLKGGRDFAKSFTAKETRAQVVDILVKYAQVKDPKMYDVMEMGYVDPNGTLDMKSMDLQYKWFVDKGLYTGKKTLNDVVDQSFAEYAAQKLGKQ